MPRKRHKSSDNLVDMLGEYIFDLFMVLIYHSVFHMALLIVLITMLSGLGRGNN